MKGFYSGFAAALVTFSLAGLFATVMALSYRDVSELAELGAVRAFDRAQDAQAVFADVVAEAALDAAFAAHGCQVGPGMCASDGFSSRVSAYASDAASRLSDGVAVRVQVGGVSCRDIVPPPGADAAYEVNASLAVTVEGFRAKVPVVVNVSYAVQAFSAPGGRIAVDADPPWVVQFQCP